MSSPPLHDRELDVVLYGATGFTGQLVAAYLEQRYGASGTLRWALAGRDRAKLEAVRERLGAAELPLLVADAGDALAVDALARRARVVCTTVGPYARYGSPLVAACAGTGTHYCDLTGELHWIRRMLDAHQEEARRSGARLVPCCGFDSIPSDLGAYFVQREMRTRYGAPSPRVKAGVDGFSGAFSGGTVASMLDMLETVSKDSSVRRLIADPYALNPEGERRGPPAPDLRAPVYDEDFGQWCAPFVMAGINTRVVRRSAALLGSAYGPDFRYEESQLTGSGPLGAARAGAVAAGTLAGMGAMAIGPVRRLVATRLPKPGEGPTPEQQEQGYWKLRFFGEAPERPGAEPLRAVLRGDRDPGYGSTSRMLAESAVCLAQDALEAEGGFHTPASAMGDALIGRLEKSAGVSFELAA